MGEHKKKEKESMEKQRGITLIVLVITIIVLIILAGISITALVGENGIISKAKQAKENTIQAEEKEKQALNQVDIAMQEKIRDIVQVTDTNPGTLEGAGTVNEPYVINSIEDLVVFAYQVSSGTKRFENQFVTLGTNLDFQSDKSYVDSKRTDYASYGYTGNLKQALTTQEGWQGIRNIRKYISRNI